jgi:hypothetical protein
MQSTLPSGDSVAREFCPDLKPYVIELKQWLPQDQLTELASLSADELIETHMGLGMEIRNAWLWGDNRPELVRYFRGKGVNHPDDMSGILIECLYRETKTFVTDEMIENYKKKRESEERKRVEKLCGKVIKSIEYFLANNKEELLKCYRKADESADELNPPPFRLIDLQGIGTIYRVTPFSSMKVVVYNCIMREIDKIFGYRREHGPRIVIEMSPEMQMTCYPFVSVE